MSLIHNVTFDSQTRVLSLLDKAGNVISSCEVPSKELVDDITKPLTFRATQDGSTVTLRKNNSPEGEFQTSRDGGNTWSDYTIGSKITLNTGDEVSFRAKADRTSRQYNTTYFYFGMTGKIEAWHNVMSMLSPSDFATYESMVDYAFYRLFYNCQSLTKAPALPATKLVDSCYNSMFYYCSSLTEAPALPATKLPSSCYQSMFGNCTSLTKAPVLTVTTLDSSCFRYMFDGCSSLNEVHCQMPSTISGVTRYTEYWLRDVASTGTFYTNADANWPSGASGIPEGWTRVNEEAPAVDDVTKPLTFRATQDGSTVKLTKVTLNTTVKLYVSFKTSRDGGNTWEDYTLGTTITLNTGDEVSFRTSSDRTSPQSHQSGEKYLRFEMKGKIEAWHNVMSLYRTSDFATYDPTNVIGSHWFYELFAGCTSLTKAPALPATTLTDNCYSTMFAACTSLTKAPALPATTLADKCYVRMFSGCQSLKEVRIAATKTASRSLEEWLNNVSATGDFYCDPNATIFPSGTSGIPANWNRHALADYPVTP